MWLLFSCSFSSSHISLLSSPQAGLVDDMNELAMRFMSEADKREEVLSEATAKAERDDDPQ